MEHSSRRDVTDITSTISMTNGDNRYHGVHRQEPSKFSTQCAGRSNGDRDEDERQDYEDNLATQFDLRDARIRELEYQCEAYRVKEKDTTDLQALNASLERRLDLLTHELINGHITSQPQSPHPPSQSQSPVLEFRRQSTFPKLPILHTSVPQTPDLTNNGAEGTFAPRTLSPQRMETVPVSPTRTRQHRQIRASIMQQSPHSTPANSRPNSMLFSPSFKEAIWETPLKRAETIDTCKRTSRTMRKFASGSNTLKPLVLPATSNRQSLPLSAPADNVFYPLPGSSPPSTRPSTAEARKEALQALEGKPNADLESRQAQRMSENVEPEAPLIIGLEPPSSAGTAFAAQSKPIDRLSTLKWLPLAQWRPPKLCEHCVEPPFRQQLRTWYQASIGLILSLEVALRYGPEAVINAMKSYDTLAAGPSEREKVPLQNSGRNDAKKDQESTRTSKTLETNLDSGYGE